MAFTLGPNGVISQAQYAALETRAAQVEQEVAIWIVESEFKISLDEEYQKPYDKVDELCNRGLLTKEEVDSIKESSNICNKIKIGTRTIKFIVNKNYINDGNNV